MMSTNGHYSFRHFENLLLRLRWYISDIVRQNTGRYTGSDILTPPILLFETRNTPRYVMRAYLLFCRHSLHASFHLMQLHAGAKIKLSIAYGICFRNVPRASLPIKESRIGLKCFQCGVPFFFTEFCCFEVSIGCYCPRWSTQISSNVNTEFHEYKSNCQAIEDDEISMRIMLLRISLMMALIRIEEIRLWTSLLDAW